MIVSQEVWRTKFSNMRQKYMQNNEKGVKTNESGKKRKTTGNNCTIRNKTSNSPGNRSTDITEEMADVQVMLDQLRIIFNNEDQVESNIEFKIKRTHQRAGID